MSCKIKLSNYHGPYLVGSKITGNVICDFNHSIDVRGINVKLKGLEKVKWHRGKYTHSDENAFLAEDRLLASAGTVAPGRIEYPFTFTLPQNIPTSYSGRYGWVTYSLQANVDIPFGAGYNDQTIFHVVFPLDLNKLVDTTLLRPSTCQAEKTLFSCCIGGGDITMKVTLEKRAFVPGETIKVGVKIYNNSNDDIQYIKVQLAIIVKCTVRELQQTEDEEKLVAETKLTSLGTDREGYYEIFLKLPTFDSVPNFFNCRLLSFGSDLKVIGGLPGIHKNITVSVPTTLGDIPIGGEEEYLRSLEQGGTRYAQIRMMS